MFRRFEIHSVRCSDLIFLIENCFKTPWWFRFISNHIIQLTTRSTDGFKFFLLLEEKKIRRSGTAEIVSRFKITRSFNGGPEEIIETGSEAIPCYVDQKKKTVVVHATGKENRSWVINYKIGTSPLLNPLIYPSEILG